MLDSPGDAVNGSRIVAAIYGYAICLIAVLLVIFNGAGFVTNAFRIANPGLSEMHRGDVVFRTFGPHPRFGPGLPPPELLGQIRVPAGASPGASPSAKVIQPPEQFEVVAGRMTAEPRLDAVRGLVVNIVLLVIAALLFRAHWRWLGNRTRPA